MSTHVLLCVDDFLNALGYVRRCVWVARRYPLYMLLDIASILFGQSVDDCLVGALYVFVVWIQQIRKHSGKMWPPKGISNLHTSS